MHISMVIVTGLLLTSACGGINVDETPDATQAIETVDTTTVDTTTGPETTEPETIEVAPEIGPPPQCGPGSVPVLFECDDNDPCSDDVCVDGACQHIVVVECCRADSDCDDGIACTSDSCTPAHRCSSVRDDSFCCTKAADCEDNDACTAGVCAANQCVYPIEPDCEVPSITYCNDQNACTSEAWGDGHCRYTSRADPGCCSVDAECDALALAQGLDAVARCQESRCWFGRRACTRSQDCVGPGYCSTGTCEEGECRYPASATCCETHAACADEWPATQDRCVDHRCVSALEAQACATDDACVAPNACIATSCVSGQCHAALRQDAGCCAVDGDCSTTDRCASVACVDGQCVATPTTAPAAFVFESFATLDTWTVEADGSGAAWGLSGAQFISAPAALYFGTAAGDYDVGATHGSITSPPFTLPAAYSSELLHVRLWRNLAVEPISSRDTIALHVLPADGAPILIWDKSHNSGPGLGWRDDEIAFPPGLTGPVRLRLTFDSIDAVDNTRAGIFVDDIRLMAPCP